MQFKSCNILRYGYTLGTLFEEDSLTWDDWIPGLIPRLNVYIITTMLCHLRESLEEITEQKVSV